MGGSLRARQSSISRLKRTALHRYPFAKMGIPIAKYERDDFLTVPALMKHSGMSRRTVMKWLHHPTTPLPYRKIGNKILVTVSEFRAWADQFKVEPNAVDVAAIVREVTQR